MAEHRPCKPAASALLAICAAPDADHSARFRLLDEADWHRLVDLAEEQRAVPLVRRAARAVAVAEPARRRIDAAAVLHTQALLRHRATLTAVLAALSAAGMAPIALKGVRLAWRDYPQPVLRPLRDLDLLLPPDQAERAQALLLASGDCTLLDGARRYDVNHSHQLPELRDRRHGTLIELHHRLNARGWRQEPALLAMIHAGREPLDLGGGLVAEVPAAHANFLHLVEHATLHHLFDNGPLVLADLHFAAREIDWPRLLGEARSLGLTRALRLVATIAARHGATWVPRELAVGLAPDPAQVALGEQALLRSDEERRKIALLRRLGQRAGTRPGLGAGLRAALRPDPTALAAIARSGPRSRRRWLGYPVWLVRRLLEYARAGGRATRRRASDQLALHAWLHDG